MAGELSGNHQPDDSDLIAWADNVDGAIAEIKAWTASDIPLDPAGSSDLVGPNIQGSLEALLTLVQQGGSGSCFLQ